MYVLVQRRSYLCCPTRQPLFQTNSVRQRPTLRTFCTSILVYERQLCSDYHQHSEAMSTYTPVNQGLNKPGHWSFSLCNRMRPPLWPSPDSRPRSYTYELHWAPRLSWSSRLTIAKNFLIAESTPFTIAEMQHQRFYTHGNLSSIIGSIKVWHLNLTLLLSFV